MTIRVFNVGSSSFKTRDFGDGPLEAIGHRFVNGGPSFTGPALVNADVIERLEAAVPLAPLHNRAALEIIKAGMEEYYNLQAVPNYVFFDTTFHRTIPYLRRLYAVPESWNAPLRNGFHGLSHESVARAYSAAYPRIISCHLGAGASLCAIHKGKSVATTMGASPMEGLVMATRSGSIDPVLILDEVRKGRTADQIEDDLNRRSGLQALAGVPDWKKLRHSRSPACRVFTDSVAQGIAAMAATMGGADLVVLTGGIGANDAELQADLEASCRFVSKNWTRRAADEEAFIAKSLLETL